MTTLPTVDIKGKKYVTVNERLKYFREHHPGFSLETEMVSVTDDDALMRAVIRNEEGQILATGTAREVRTDKGSFVNATSYVENCETSAWGRALANFGIGIDASVASADEVVQAINAPTEPPKKKPPSKVDVMEALNKCTSEKAVDITFGQAKKYKWSDEDLKDLEECKDNVLKNFDE